MKYFGYHNKILHIDLSKKTFKIETPETNFFRKYSGGGLLGSYLLLKKTKPNIDPLSINNILIFINSVISGNNGPGLSRFTICAKSPLTNGIGEARCEGRWSNALKSSGFDTIIFYGKSHKPINILVENKKVKFIDAKKVWGKTIGFTNDHLEKKLGKNICSAVIGPAGENLVRYASIVSNRSNQAERMGMGAVMGSKNLKSVIIREQNYSPKIYDIKLLNKIKLQIILIKKEKKIYFLHGKKIYQVWQFGSTIMDLMQLLMLKTIELQNLNILIIMKKSIGCLITKEFKNAQVVLMIV